jgi:hypothetical protein
MNENAFYLLMGLAGSIAGFYSQRLRASGAIAMMLPVVSGMTLWLAIGRG